MEESWISGEQGVLMEKFLLLFSRLSLAWLFIKAGLPKIAYPLIFVVAIESYNMVPAIFVPGIAVALPWLEVVCGLSLAVGFASRGASLMTSVLSIFFAVLVSSALWQGLDISCGCFTGDISKIRWSHVGLNLIMLVLSMWVYVRGPGWLSLEGLRSTPQAQK